MKTEYKLKGKDAEGRDVSVRTDEDGSHPTATWTIPLQKVPTNVIAQGKPYASKHGYEFTRALLVTRCEPLAGPDHRSLELFPQGHDPIEAGRRDVRLGFQHGPVPASRP